MSSHVFTMVDRVWFDVGGLAEFQQVHECSHHLHVTSAPWQVKFTNAIDSPGGYAQWRSSQGIPFGIKLWNLPKISQNGIFKFLYLWNIFITFHNCFWQILQSSQVLFQADSRNCMWISIDLLRPAHLQMSDQLQDVSHPMTGSTERQETLNCALGIPSRPLAWDLGSGAIHCQLMGLPSGKLTVCY